MQGSLRNVFLAAIVLAFSVDAVSQNPINANARRHIDAGNSTWIEGMKSGDVTRIVAVFIEDAVECASTGDCIRGRSAIEQKLMDRIAKTGRAQSATVKSIGSVQQGDFVYEWGHSETVFPDGKKMGGRFLTVWERQPDGEWKILRNMGIPGDLRHLSVGSRANDLGALVGSSSARPDRSTVGAELR